MLLSWLGGLASQDRVGRAERRQRSCRWAVKGTGIDIIHPPEIEIGIGADGAVGVSGKLDGAE